MDCATDINNFAVYHNLILSEFNCSCMFSEQILTIIVTLQVLRIMFKFLPNIIYWNYSFQNVSDKS